MENDNHDKDSKGNDCSDDGINDIGDDDYNLSVAVNNTSVYNISTNFPTQCSDLYYQFAEWFRKRSFAHRRWFCKRQDGCRHGFAT